MASSGIHRKIDDLGRIVIPVGIRRNLGITEGDRLEVTVEDDRIILARPTDQCVVCQSEDDLVTVRDRNVCADCIDDLARARQGLAPVDRTVASDDTTSDDQVVVLGEPVSPNSKNAW